MIYIFVVYLLILTCMDIRFRRLPAIWIWCGLLIMSVYGVVLIVLERRSFFDLLAALLPGFFLILFSKCTGQIGDGDGFIILLTGFFFTVKEEWTVVLVSFFLAAAGAICLVVCKRSSRNKRIPFVPFITMAVICVEFINFT